MDRKQILAKPLWTTTDVAFLLGSCTRTICGDIASGKLPRTNIGNRRMIARCDLVAYLGQDRADEILQVV